MDEKAISINWFAMMTLAMSIAGELMTAIGPGGLTAPIVVPGIKTYVGKTHLEIDVTITPLP